MPANVSGSAAIMPSILQGPHLPHHQLRQLPGGTLAVEGLDAPELEPEQLFEPPLDAPPELVPYLLNPVERGAELAGAPGPLLGPDPQVEGPVGDDLSHSP